MAAHAILSPSSASQWSSCHAAPAMQLGLPESSSEFAEEGTAAHEAATQCLETGVDAAALIGQVFNERFTLDEEMARFIQVGYIDHVRKIAEGGALMVEQRLSISHITGEEDAYGTSDTVILLDSEIIIADLKYGMGVKVDAQDNKQLAMYALAALEEFSMLGDFKTVRMMIFQPRLHHVSEWAITVDELLAIGEQLNTHARRAGLLIRYAITDGIKSLETAYHDCFVPSDDNCRWCKAAGNCKAQTQFVINTVAGDFVDLDDDIAKPLAAAPERVKHADEPHIASLMPHLDLIESFCKAVRARGEAIIHNGGHVPGFKLVLGKAGNRAWTSEEEAESAMKAMRLKEAEMYTFKVISPTQAEKVLADKPRRWKKLQPLITMAPGKPTVVPESDKRPALVVTKPEEDFADLSEDASDLI